MRCIVCNKSPHVSTRLVVLDPHNVESGIHHLCHADTDRRIKADTIYYKYNNDEVDRNKDKEYWKKNAEKRDYKLNNCGRCGRRLFNPEFKWAFYYISENISPRSDYRTCDDCADEILVKLNIRKRDESQTKLVTNYVRAE